jgi:DNA-binding MarR family transcriptional regulator
MRLAHHQVFQNLDREGTRVTALAERAGMTHQGMGELVAELVELGYLERTADPDDGLSRLVRPTAEGRRSLEDDLQVDQVLDALRALRHLREDDVTAAVAQDPAS